MSQRFARLRRSLPALGLLSGLTWPLAAQELPPPPRALQPGPMPAPAPTAALGPMLLDPVPVQLPDYSWIAIEAPPLPSLIKVHDILTIEVDEKAEVIVNSRFNRQRNGAYKLELKDFIRVVTGPPQLLNASDNQPKIEGTLQNRLQTIGQATDQEGITYKIAATVVDVLPNGTIVLEARKSIRTNQDLFEYRLTGRVDKGKIRPDRTARTEDIAELQIERLQRGKIFDSTKTNWGTRLLDTLMPF
jgi:flagellar L-ring protein precursor FlgH